MSTAPPPPPPPALLCRLSSRLRNDARRARLYDEHPFGSQGEFVCGLWLQVCGRLVDALLAASTRGHGDSMDIQLPVASLTPTEPTTHCDSESA
jgi:hypothetical protein